jgi:hypothetical protein
MGFFKTLIFMGVLGVFTCVTFMVSQAPKHGPIHRPGPRVG